MINKCYQNQPFLGSESGSESFSPHTCFRRHPSRALSSVQRQLCMLLISVLSVIVLKHYASLYTRSAAADEGCTSCTSRTFITAEDQWGSLSDCWSLEVLEVDVLADDAIFDLWPEGPSRRAISVVAWGESCTGKPGLPDHIWLWALAHTSTFSKKQFRNKAQTELF